MWPKDLCRSLWSESTDEEGQWLLTTTSEPLILMSERRRPIAIPICGFSLCVFCLFLLWLCLRWNSVKIVLAQFRFSKSWFVITASFTNLDLLYLLTQGTGRRCSMLLLPFLHRGVGCGRQRQIGGSELSQMPFAIIDAHGDSFLQHSTSSELSARPPTAPKNSRHDDSSLSATDRT